MRYGSVGGLEYEVPQSRLYCLCINVALCSTALQCICRVIRRSCTTMKAHTYYIIFGRPPIGIRNKASLLRDGKTWEPTILSSQTILWTMQSRELPGERDNARNNARCTKARKATHGLDGQHQDVDRTLRGRVNQNDRGQEKVRPWCGQPSGRGRLKNRNRNP